MSEAFVLVLQSIVQLSVVISALVAALSVFVVHWNVHWAHIHYSGLHSSARLAGNQDTAFHNHQEYLTETYI
jgi:hypothetical protein